MRVDLSAVEDGAVFDADLCIVGAGAAGITIARDLAGSSLRICLLEGGGFAASRASQDLYAGRMLNSYTDRPGHLEYLKLPDAMVSSLSLISVPNPSGEISADYTDYTHFSPAGPDPERSGSPVPRSGRQAVQLRPVSLDAFTGPTMIWNLAVIHLLLGQHDDAIEQLAALGEAPSRLELPPLRLDPTWDRLRDDPRFQRLVERRD